MSNLKSTFGQNKYRAIRLTLDPNKFSKVTDTSIAALDLVRNIKNRDYFYNLSDYGGRAVIFDVFSNVNAYYRKKFHLLPPNIFVLQYLYNKLKKSKSHNKCATCTILDLPCGLGNMLGYLQILLPNATICGADNFEQISEEDVNKYQSLSFKKKVFKVHRERGVDFMITIGLPLSWLELDVIKIKPKSIIYETKCFDEERDKKVLEKYEIDFFNEHIIVFSRM